MRQEVPATQPPAATFAHPTEAQRVLRGAVLGAALGLVFLVLGRRRGRAGRGR